MTNVNFYLWRPVIENMATLTEIRENWNLMDLADCHEVLDIKAEAEAHHQEEADKDQKRRSKG